jgi:hypothetical protein
MKFVLFIILFSLNMIGGNFLTGVATPNYVKSITFENSSGKNVDV